MAPKKAAPAPTGTKSISSFFAKTPPSAAKSVDAAKAVTKSPVTAAPQAVAPGGSPPGKVAELEAVTPPKGDEAPEKSSGSKTISKSLIKNVHSSPAKVSPWNSPWSPHPPTGRGERLCTRIGSDRRQFDQSNQANCLPEYLTLVHSSQTPAKSPKRKSEDDLPQRKNLALDSDEEAGSPGGSPSGRRPKRAATKRRSLVESDSGASRYSEGESERDRDSV